MKTFRIIGLALVAILICLSACSGGGDDPIEPTPQPEIIKSEITIDSSILTNGLSFTSEKGEQSISFSTNESWTLSVASTTSGATWCTTSATSGSKGTANVKFTVSENTDYDNRSVSVTIKSGTATKTFTISQKCADALLITKDKYEIAQEGGTIDIEVKANVEYKMEISEEAKDWITESSSRGLTPYKHSLKIAMNEENEKREGEVIFKSGDKLETVKIYQTGGAIFLLSQNEFSVSDKGGSISVDIQSNIEYGVQMPNVDWIIDESSSRGLSSHTLKYTIKANEGYDNRSAFIVFYDKNSELKDTLRIMQAQKDAIILSQKEFIVEQEGGNIEVKLNTNVDLELQIPSDVTWITQSNSRALTEKSIYLKVAENTDEGIRSANIAIINKESQLSEIIVIKQQGNISLVKLEKAGTLVTALGDDYLNITSLKIVGPIDGTDIFYLRQMLGASNFSKRGKLATLDLSEATIVEGGSKYYMSYYSTSNKIIGECMFAQCPNLKHFIMPDNTTIIEQYAFLECTSLNSITIGKSVSSIGTYAFNRCSSLTSIVIPDTVTSIGYFAFEGCSSLSTVTIGDGVTSIGNFAFRDCISLASVDISDNVVSVGKCAFSGCTSLSTVIIGDNVTSVGEYAFRDCSSLTSVSIGRSIKSIGNSAFYFCNSIHSVYIADISSWLNVEFGNAYNTNPLHIGAKLYVNNKEFTELEVPENIKEIKNNVFYGCKTLERVIIGDNVASIGDHAFYNCDSLISVTIGDGVTKIDEFAFYSCI